MIFNTPYIPHKVIVCNQEKNENLERSTEEMYEWHKIIPITCKAFMNRNIYCVT